jgi:hypothetical protein
VFRALLAFFRRPAIRSGPKRDSRGRFRDPRFATFIAQNNRRTVDTDLQDTVLRGRKIMRNTLRLAAFGGAAWVLLESAKALSVF